MGKVADIKKKQNDASVEVFLNSVTDENKRKDSFTILQMMKKVSGAQPKMWGDSLIGFGNRRFKSPASGREVDWFLIGFSPRKAAFSLYMGLDLKQHDAALKKLGKHKTGRGCLYINKLEDIDKKVLEGIIKESLKANK